MKRKNVLMIFTDQQRADTIHALGNDKIVTPALDSIANEAVVFDRCYTPSPVCVPARLCMKAGQYCARTGNNNNNPNIAYDGEGFYKRFTDAGYNTCAIGKMHNSPVLYDGMGFRKRISQEELSHPDDDYTNFICNSPYKYVFDYMGQRSDMYYIPQISQLPAEVHPTQWIGDNCVEFIKNADTNEEPIFLVASFIHPHPPFAPPAPWNKMYRKNVRDPFVPEDPDSYEDMLRNKYTCDALGISPRRLELLNQYYYACISFVDYQIGRIIAELKAKGIYDDTIIMFSSDHGDMMGDYASMGKRTMLDAAARIPFLLKIPGKEHEIRVDPASLVDVAPTLLSACGIDYDPADFDGVNLMTDSHDFVYSQYGNGTIGIYMVASGEDKLVYSAVGNRYFYFDSFPDAVDKYDENNERVMYLKQKLDDYIACDVCTEIETEPKESPARQPKYSFYPPLNDHIRRMDEEKGRMPEGYDIVVGSKQTDFW
ncbi:MAG: sulfatase-like hydrolase/transferase [Clostridia bacterium]|nr:sulfatase-like hydrolase/transferase [Clostridia bacterium]